jgi:ABC-type Fe3+-hydroxamate transport system substrate-binding protein
MRTRLLVTATVAAVTVLALTACGTTEEAADAPSSASAAGPIVLTDASGAEIKLDGPATKVVGTEWGVVENLVSLGVDPVGVADVKGYGNWVSAVPLRNVPKDIGTRGEPSVDTIASLAPDLIVATNDLPEAAVTQIKKVAPVLLIDPANGADQITQMNTNLDLIAKATGHEEQATTVKAAFQKKLAEGKSAIAAAGKDGTKFAFADGYVDANQVGIRPYTKTSLVGAISTELGLEPAWTVEGDKDYGLATTDVEGLTKLGDVQFMYEANAKDGDDVFADTLKSNAVWKSLPFVKSGQVNRLPDGIWMFGGPASMQAYIDGVVAVLTK